MKKLFIVPALIVVMAAFKTSNYEQPKYDLSKVHPAKAPAFEAQDSLKNDVQAINASLTELNQKL